MTSAVLELPSTSEERRELVQQTAVRYYKRKTRNSRAFLWATSLGLVIAFIPLFSILYSVVRNGVSYITWQFLATPPDLLGPDFHHQHRIGGISNAIEGTALVFGVALLMAVPVSILVGIALYESRGKVMGALRVLLEVMIGMPSILFGIFIYVFVVARMHYQLTGMAGSLALMVLMVPLMAISCEQALRATPQVLTEAGLALGAKRSQVMRKVVLPYSRPRILTGLMLAASRAIGETAPVVLVIGSTYLANWNWKTPQTTLTTFMFNLVNSPYHYQLYEVWAVALILIVVVFVLNLTGRIIVARLNRGHR